MESLRTNVNLGTNVFKKKVGVAAIEEKMKETFQGHVRRRPVKAAARKCSSNGG